ncbi:ribosome biogenesis protein Nop16-domain-containing protein [Jimgerdemannia flammicorona]|uniref:Nucleolar protein 16 n=1 Tax=Jimgerdemannia flammicorona TaxID=994334 RepID=A0A433QKL6_9FUNG|nr:ribosome biogenesis protein Nop16-domain-containing protein [Jimgerdemannia flammicorona]
MARPRARRTTRNPGAKVSRRTANKHMKRVNIVSNEIIAKAWDKKKTLRQKYDLFCYPLSFLNNQTLTLLPALHPSYERLGLMTTLNGNTGGREAKTTTEPLEEPTEADMEADMEELEDLLGPNEGIIQRDEQGNVVRVIVGREKTFEEVVEQEIKPVKAKTDVVKALEARAANGCKLERHQSEFEVSWVQKLIDKHGDDYEAMFWDKKLNVYQQTTAQLKKKVVMYLKKQK